MEYNVSSVLSLISHLHTATADFTNKRLSEKGNYVSSHGFILYLLSQEKMLTKGEIAKKINRDKSTTTVLIKKLKDEELIHEETSSTDSRVKFISLTEKGKEYNKLTKEISDDLLECCYRNFSEQEKHELLALLCKMNKNLSDDLDNNLK